MSADTRVQSLYLPKTQRERLRQYAEKNGMSVSEAAREFMAAYVSGEAPPDRKRSTERVSIWVVPEEYAEFMRVARANGHRASAALEVAMGDLA